MLLAGSGCIAIQTINIDEQKAVNKITSLQYHDAAKNIESDAIVKMNQLTQRYITNLRTCEPVHFNQSLDLFGLKISLTADINGWIDNKCSYSLSGKIDAIGKDIREVYNLNITDEEISHLEPVVKCNFSQDQLNILVDAIAAASSNRADEAELTPVSNKLQSDKKAELTPQEEKAIEMLVNGNVCTVPNIGEIMMQYSEFSKHKP